MKLTEKEKEKLKKAFLQAEKRVMTKIKKRMQKLAEDEELRNKMMNEIEKELGHI